jgi:alkylhydroperoxidase/carboxymuconolactone decarboxylase family protein YurZ
MSPDERAKRQCGDAGAVPFRVEETLQRLATGGKTAPGSPELDDKTAALVRLGALVALDAAPISYRQATDMAFGAGATPDEVVASLIAVAPAVGLARLVSATPRLALAAGYDVDAAFETPPREGSAHGPPDPRGDGREPGPVRADGARPVQRRQRPDPA